MVDTVVDNGVVVPNDIIVHHGAVAIDVRRSFGRHHVVHRMMISEVARMNESVVIVAKPKVEAEAHVMVPVGESDSRTHVAMRRQRSPTAVVTRASPGHPTRTPGVIGAPDPAHAWSTEPAAIMERSPTPRIIRVPVP